MSVAHTFLFAVGNSMTTWGNLSELPGVAGDVDKVFDTMVEGEAGFGLADRSQSVKLLDKGAREVKERWEQFLETVEIDAFIVFYFAGHGALVGAHDLRLLLADSERSRKDESTLSVLQLIRALENKRVAEWAVILDCCESGEVTRDMAIQGTRTRTNRGSLIACATSTGRAWETPEHGAPFTSRLTEAIRTGSCMPPGAVFVDILRAATWAKDQLPEPRPLVDHWGSADLRVARILPILVESRPLPQSEIPSPPKDAQRVGFDSTVASRIDSAPKTDSNVRRRYLRTVRRHIENLQRETVHSVQSIDLAIEDTPWATRLPWGYKNPDRTQSFSRIDEAFEAFERRLLILGQPGSGKSTTLLSLGILLLCEAETNPNAPVPLLVSLSHFTAMHQSEHADLNTLVAWLTSELAQTGVPSSMAHRWISDNGCALLLDGLDECEKTVRQTMIDLLNKSSVELDCLQSYAAEPANTGRCKNWTASTPYGYWVQLRSSH